MIPKPVKDTAILAAVAFYAAEIHEEPAGSNKGFFVELFQQSIGLPVGVAWCMAFVLYIFQKAFNTHGLVCMLHKSGQCKAVWDNTDADAKLSAVKILAGEHIEPGSIFIVVHPGGTGHTGIVISHWQHDSDHRKDVIKTIEGNASDAISKRRYALGDFIDADFQGVIY